MAATRLRSSWARAIVIPSLSRPSAPSQREPRSCTTPGEFVSDTIIDGTHTSVSNESPANPSGITPTTTKGRSFSEMVRCRMAGIAPEPIAPQRAADDRHGVAVGHRIFLGQERTAERGRCTEEREIAR